MDFSIIFQLRNKKFWWMDVIFYFVISVLIAVLFCYAILIIKDYFLRKDIEKETVALETVGTELQKQHETEVITYRNKINDFSELFKNHNFASNVFSFIQGQTRNNIWFKQFNLEQKSNAIQLSGEADDMDAFSRQVAVFENLDNKKYIKSLGALNSAISQSSRIEFDINLVLEPTIFDYLTSQVLAPKEEVVVVEPSEEEGENSEGEDNVPTKSIEKIITSFHLIMNPDVAGVINQTSYTIALSVPYGTDVKNLTPSIVYSPKATLSPESDIPQDFTNPVIYTVTAEDGSIQKYKATVYVLPQEKKGGISWFTWVIVIIIIIVVIIAAITAFVFLKNKRSQ